MMINEECGIRDGRFDDCALGFDKDGKGSVGSFNYI